MRGFRRWLPFFCLPILLTGLLMLGCPLCRFFSISCPGCGLTRAWICFLQGEFRQAFAHHPFFLPAPLFVGLYAAREYIPQKFRLWIDVVLFVFAILVAVYHILAR